MTEPISTPLYVTGIPTLGPFTEPNSNDAVLAHCTFPTPRKKKIDSAFVPELGAGRPLLFADDGSVIASNEARLRQQPFELAAQQRLRRFFIEEDGKLEAR
jgi:hypothetical protein